ncbi:MAG: hypothetical protein PHT46_05815 [Candidatus Marinimicrobia bacterium]|jgi:hypothetical protein|nr:hypothetical protein [Candidatus Neomarinimicrobiota bacterium]MDD5709677.1 hypothetical protein [Candidatus Neomarinimicrobiota bacterium]MDX9777684.1 hypothetical protein [bacterium]
MKLSFLRLIYNIFFRLSPLLILALIELSLRFLGAGDSYRLFQHTDDKSHYELNPLFYQRFISAEQFPDIRLPEQRFPAEKSPDSKRIFLLADQSLFALIPDALQKALLEDFYGSDSVRYEIIQVAVPHGNSFSVRHLIQEIRKYEPDAALLLTGNNEFYGIPRKSNWIKDADNYWGLRAYVAMKQFRFFQVLERFVYIKNDPAVAFPPPDPDAWAVPRESLSYREVQSLFTRNLENIADKAKFPVIFVSIPVNLKQVPYRSDFKDKELLDADFARECAILVNNADRFMLERWIQELQAWEPGTAIGYYCQAMILEREKDSDMALENYRKAAEMDLFRVRNAIAFNADIREIGSRENVFLIDTEKTFREYTEGGLHINRYFVNGITLNESGKLLFRKLLRDGLVSCLQP